MPHWSKVRESWPLLTNPTPRPTVPPRPSRPEIVPRSGSIGTVGRSTRTGHRGSVGTDRRTSSGSVISAKRTVARAPSLGSRAGSGQVKSGMVRGVSGGSFYWGQLVSEGGESEVAKEEEVMKRRQKVVLMLLLLLCDATAS